MSDKNTPSDQEVVEQTIEQVEPAAEVEVEEGQLLSAEERIAELEAALAASNAKVEEQQESVLRAMAEADNARRRAAQDSEKARKFALEKFAGDMLSVIDNLERGLQLADAENDAIKPMIEGVELTMKGLMDAVAKHGVVQLDPVGQTFNPEQHQAMSMQESPDHAPNTVMLVMQKGYELNGRLLRPAMVMVAKAPASGIDTEA
ncbi:nucleotide exchange factor GrpE [Corallincola holothuriorum]|uniref:Protein GrpE n=1 Tax=Corallincola holothuriorum TaxID=2282215 RepID=A0A368NH90_9GAMM|nr:nucleotide exchange factor GrpE [Corallincola holothuriorum]RCU48769.1 nucleotide exchange factor GrpE [Corallincola holothuriorum]